MELLHTWPVNVRQNSNVGKHSHSDQNRREIRLLAAAEVQ